MTERPPPTPWERIMRAYKRQTGLRLSGDEVNRLGQDGAIEQRAAYDQEIADDIEADRETDADLL